MKEEPFTIWSSRKPLVILSLQRTNRLLTMTNPTIGLVVPFAVGVRALTPEGYDPAMAAILPAAEHLAKQNVDAIMVIGTSLTFYKGADVHRRLLAQLRAATGL